MRKSLSRLSRSLAMGVRRTRKEVVATTFWQEQVPRNDIVRWHESRLRRNNEQRDFSVRECRASQVDP